MPDEDIKTPEKDYGNMTSDENDYGNSKKDSDEVTKDLDEKMGETLDADIDSPTFPDEFPEPAPPVDTDEEDTSIPDGMNADSDLESDPSKEVPIDEPNPEQKREGAFHFFIVHESSGKIEIAETVQPGVVSYAFDPDHVTPRDIRYMLEAATQVIDLDDESTSVTLIMDPVADVKRADIWLNIKHRPNIRIGVMELWRYNT